MFILVESLQNIAAFNFLLFGFILIFLNRQKHESNFWFGCFLIGKGFTLLSNIILFSNQFADNISILSIGLILNSFLLFYSPFLFIYSKALVSGKIKIMTYWYHFIPFVVFVLLNTLTIAHIHGYENGIAEAYLKQNIDWIGYFYYTQAVFYTFLSITYVFKEKRKSKEYLSNLQNYKFNWFVNVLSLFFIVWFSYLFANLFAGSSIEHVSSFFDLLGTVLLLILANYTAVTGFRKPGLLTDTKINKPSSKKTISLPEVHYEDLLLLMKEEKLFKNPDLNLQTLSEKLNLSARNTSLLIKEKTDKNFYDFINSYRIEEAKRILSEDQSKPTILEILYEVGFNSKSVFNTTFKKQVNLTPTQYRNQHLKIA